MAHKATFTLQRNRHPVIFFFLFPKREINRRFKKPSCQEWHFANGVYAIYDLAVAPVTFNLSDFLIYSDLKAKAYGFVKFTLVIVNRPERKYNYDYDAIIDVEKKIWRVGNLLFPLALNYSDCENIIICSNTKSLKMLTKEGIVVPETYSVGIPTYLKASDFREITKVYKTQTGFKVNAQAIRHVEGFCKENSLKNLVTITIRNYKFDLERNSNVSEWVAFSEWLVERNYSVIVIPDAESPFDKMPQFSRAIVGSIFCWNLSLRLALYEKSIINFGMANGPMALAMSSKFVNVAIMKCRLGAADIWKSQVEVMKPDYCEENHFFFEGDDRLEILKMAFTECISALECRATEFLVGKL